MRMTAFWLILIAGVGLLISSPRSAEASPAGAGGPSMTLWFGGDVHLGLRPSDPLGAIAAMLAGTPGVVNLEGPVGTAVESDTSAVGAVLPPDAAIRLENSGEALTRLRDAGVVLVSIANNHAFDAGREAPRQSAAAIRRAGMRPVGLDVGHAVIRRRGMRAAVAAFDVSAGAPRDYELQLARALRAGDALIVTLHDTGPPSYLPSARLKDAAERALAAGARVIVSHGTHAMGPVERRGDAVIAWGLGNLVFHCDCTREEEALLLRVTLRPRGAVEAEVIPIRAGLRGAPARAAGAPGEWFDLLEAIGSTPLTRAGTVARF